MVNEGLSIAPETPRPGYCLVYRKAGVRALAVAILAGGSGTPAGAMLR
jgi:hypothetical protein